MKNLILICAILSITASAYSFNPINVVKEDLEIVFDKSIDKTALENIQKSLKEKGIILKFKDLEFNRKGKLKHINFTVECANEGFKGSAKNTFFSLSMRFGFSVKYTEDENSTFKVGVLK